MASNDERDQWGETPDERQARIYKRDLAWFVYSQGHARDGVPCSPRDRLHFNAGYDAGRADYLPREVVPNVSTDDEREWEYGYGPFVAVHATAKGQSDD